MSELPWSEQYRPKVLKDLVNPPALQSRLVDLSNLNKVPNLIFVGPSGTGKTSTALCLVNDRPGRICLELNAGSERCVNTIRNRVVDFVGKKTTADKFVILDEVNSMPSASQHVLKGVMDLHMKASFILCCNDSDKVLPTIQSRCLRLAFQKLPEDQITTRLLEIAQVEGCKMTAAGARAIAESCGGDLRSALNSLQLYTKGGRVTSAGVNHQYKLSCLNQSERLVVYCQKNSAEKLTRVLECMKQMLQSGQPHGEILKNLLVSINSMNISKKDRASLIGCVMSCHQRHLEGSDSDLQMLGLAVDLAHCT